MATELYIEPERRDRNALNGQFLKGNTPHNKGKRWNEWKFQIARLNAEVHRLRETNNTLIYELNKEKEKNKK